MTGTSAGHSAFEDQGVVGRTRLDQVATLVTSPAMCPDPDEMLVIALRPDGVDVEFGNLGQNGNLYEKIA